MGIISTALVLASEEAAESGGLSPYVFGAFTFVALGALLVVTWLLKVGD